MQPMTKTQACRIVHNCAVVYRDNLVNKNVLFIAERDRIYDYFEALFLTSNFQHLTGIESKNVMTANEFYSRAVDDRITEKDIHFAADGTTRMKLYVLPKLMRIHYIARMVGNYDGSGNYLMADKIAGTTAAAMGFVKENNFYYPNSALKADVKTITIKPFLKISAIFVKSVNDEKYRSMTYIANDMDINDILKKCGISNKVSKAQSDSEFE